MAEPAPSSIWIRGRWNFCSRQESLSSGWTHCFLVLLLNAFLHELPAQGRGRGARFMNTTGEALTSSIWVERNVAVFKASRNLGPWQFEIKASISWEMQESPVNFSPFGTPLFSIRSFNCRLYTQETHYRIAVAINTDVRLVYSQFLTRDHVDQTERKLFRKSTIN